MGRYVDALITYRILRKLVTPFDQTDAYKLGIIDANGRPLKKDRDLNTSDERDAYTILDRMIFRLKRIIHKVPGDNKRIASFAAALSLIKEHVSATTEPVFLESEFIKRTATEQDLQEVTNYLSGKTLKTFRMHSEEIANSVGGGFSGQATADPNVNLAGRDIVGFKVVRRPLHKLTTARRRNEKT